MMVCKYGNTCTCPNRVNIIWASSSFLVIFFFLLVTFLLTVGSFSLSSCTSMETALSWIEVGRTQKCLIIWFGRFKFKNQMVILFFKKTWLSNLLAGCGVQSVKEHKSNNSYWHCFIYDKLNTHLHVSSVKRSQSGGWKMKRCCWRWQRRWIMTWSRTPLNWNRS